MEYREHELKYEDYLELRTSVGWTTCPRQQAEMAIDRSLLTVVVFEAIGQAVGMGRLVGDGLYDTIVDVVVRPEFQGRGIGGEIVQRLLRFAEKSVMDGGRASILLVAAEGKETFYEKLKFHTLPDAQSGAGMRLQIIKNGRL